MVHETVTATTRIRTYQTMTLVEMADLRIMEMPPLIIANTSIRHPRNTTQINTKTTMAHLQLEDIRHLHLRHHLGNPLECHLHRLLSTRQHSR